MVNICNGYHPVSDHSLTTLIAHEPAHPWPGNLVTNANWDSFWFNEGFTVCLERRIMEQLYGRDYTDMRHVLGRAALAHTIQELAPTSPATHLRLRLAGRDPYKGLTEIACEKGCALLLTRESLAASGWTPLSQEYFARFSFQTMDTDTLLGYVRAELLTAESDLKAHLQFTAWIDGPGRPANAPPVASAWLAAVAAALSQLAASTAPDSVPPPASGSSHEWVYFLNGLPPTSAATDLARLDNAFHFTGSGNAEILVAWFAHTLRAGDAPADAALEQFLLRVGQRKFAGAAIPGAAGDAGRPGTGQGHLRPLPA